MHHRRRKKQPSAMRSIELLRSRAGYGFTISGQQPCVLSCIVTGSPADCAGLKTGDYLMVVNGLNVSNASHDDVVRLIGSSLESLTLEIAENYNSSDSSEEDFQIRPKSKYPNRRGRRIQGRKEYMYGDSIDPELGGGVISDRYNRLGGLHPEMEDASEEQQIQSRWHRVEQVEHRLAPLAATLKYRGQQQHQSRPKHTIITRETRLGITKTGRQLESGPLVATASITNLRTSQDAFVPVHNSNQVERPPLGRQRQVNGSLADTLRAMVGYVGSIEMPALDRPPSWRTQSLKGAVRRLRIEQKMHTSVLMHVNNNGVHLLNALGKTIAHYPADNIVSCGVCPDDKRFFGLMTLHRSDSNGDGTQSNTLLGSSCHVFSIDPQLNRHSTHIHKAASFKIQCTMNPTTHCCAEFPPSTVLILQAMSRLCCNVDDPLDDADMPQMELPDEQRAAPNRYLSNSSTSDSGLGCVSKEPTVVSNKVCVVEMPVESDVAKLESSQNKSSHQLTKYSCSSARDAVRVSLATSTCDASAENSQVFYSCSDAHHSGGNYPQRNRLDVHGQLHSKRLQSTEAQRSVNHTHVAVQKSLPVARPPFESHAAHFRPPSSMYQNSPMQPPPLPAKLPRGVLKKSQGQRVSVSNRPPPGMVMVSTPQPHVSSRIAKYNRPKSTPPFMTDDRWEMAEADYESDPGDSFTTGRSDASVASMSLPRSRRRSRQFANDVGVVNKQSSANSSKQPESAVANSQAGGPQSCNGPPVGCAASWAVNFDNLLSAKSGLAAFTDFLKKEFSEENIKFWSRCEHYKRIQNGEERRKEAHEIFSCHLAASASDPVNVDSFAQQETQRGLQVAALQLFDAAQRQIYQLMKHDSYVRFLKSEQYKACIMAAMEGKQLPYPTNNLGTTGEKTEERKKIKKSKSTTAAEEGGDERRRRSLLPWVRNKSEKRLSRIATDSDLQKFVDTNRQDSVDGTKVQSDLVDFNQMCQQLKAATQDVAGEVFCRVCLPGNTTTVISPVAGQSLLTALGRVCERRKLCLAQYDVLHVDSNKVVDLTKDVSTLGCMEVRLVQRVVFRVDLPAKSLAVKATPEKVIRDVLKPVLLRYGLKPNSVGVHLWSSGIVVNQEASVQTVDNQRLVVKSSQDSSKWTGGGTNNATKPPIGRSRVDSDSGSCLAGVHWQATHRQLFRDIKAGSPTLHFDDSGVWDPDRKPDKKTEGAPKNHGLFGLIRKNSMGEKDGKVPKGKMKPPPPPSDNSMRPPIRGSRLDAEDERFLELLSRVQGRQLDDQRGLKPHDLQLPDFLKPNCSEEARPPSPTRDSTVSAYCLGAFHPPPGSSSDDHARHSCLGLTAVSAADTTAHSPSSGGQIQFMDQSFSQDGILPGHDEAEAYFTREPLHQAAPAAFTNTPGDDRDQRGNAGSLQIYIRSPVPSRPARGFVGNLPRPQRSDNDMSRKMLQSHVSQNDIKTDSSSSEFCANNTDDFKYNAMQQGVTMAGDVMDVDTDSIPDPVFSYVAGETVNDHFLPLFADGEFARSDTAAMETEPSTPSPTTHDLILVSESSPEVTSAQSEASDTAPATVSILKKWVVEKVSDSEGPQKTKKNLMFAECEANGDIQVSFV